MNIFLLQIILASFFSWTKWGMKTTPTTICSQVRMKLLLIKMIIWNDYYDDDYNVDDDFLPNNCCSESGKKRNYMYRDKKKHALNMKMMIKMLKMMIILNMMIILMMMMIILTMMIILNMMIILQTMMTILNMMIIL